MEDFVTFELAVKLKEKGFDWETSNMYERNIIACRYEDYPKPTISQVLKWLRKEKRIHIGILYAYPTYSTWIQAIPGCTSESQLVIHDFDDDVEAFLEGIKYVLDNLI